MDLLATLRSKIKSLDEGAYSPGLKAIILHIETAFGHLSRGQSKNEETAFTDAIYRTNQAFEGSIKEAYRVLAGKDPGKAKPADIEKYLEKKSVFRQRVLAQFTNYRREWRNPSTHDYKLDFDESEAFLAIVSVSAFACLLFDQIAEHVSYQKAKTATDARRGKLKLNQTKVTDNLRDRVTMLLNEFSKQHPILSPPNHRTPETHVLGALAGFFASTAPKIKVNMDQKLTADRNERADMILAEGKEQLIIELKRAESMSKNMYNAIAQVEHYLMVSGIKNAILYFYSEDMTDISRVDHPVPQVGAQITILKPAKTESNKSVHTDAG